MMLVVLAVTTATVYLAEENRRANQQQLLDAQFQNQVQSFLKIQEAQSAIITEKCRALSHAVRLRAALEERDVDDLYRNAVTELEGILEHPGASPGNAPDVVRASFFRFLDAEGVVLSPENHPAGLIDQPTLHEALSGMGKVLREDDEQAVGYIALARGNQPTALRQVVLTKIRDPNGRNLGTLVVGFPIGHLQDPEVDRAGAIKSGIWLNERLYIENVSAADRRFVGQRIHAAASEQTASHFPIELESGPHLLYYKALDPETQFAPAYQVCLYPLAASIREEQALRWKIIAFGLVVLSFGFAASLFVAKGLSKPVEKIVAGSVENLTRRKQAEEDLRESNRELEKALSELKATQQQVIQQERLSAIGQMASGIAHDFNNTLTPILGFAELLLENDACSRTRRKRAAASRCCAPRRRTRPASSAVCANFIGRPRRMRNFPLSIWPRSCSKPFRSPSRNGEARRRPAALTIDVATAEVKASSVGCGRGIGSARSPDQSHFQRRRRHARRRIDHDPDCYRGDEALLRVTDTGAGMTEAVRQRCLEPFFSTKGARGTGLGLSMVYGIIERHRGKLDIQSAPGQGTTFTIRLPLAAPMSTQIARRRAGCQPGRITAECSRRR